MRAIALLALWQLKNALRTSLTDLRKLVPLLFLAALGVLQVLTMNAAAVIGGPFQAEAADFLIEHHAAVRSACVLILALIALGNVDYGFGSGFLTFSLADLDYLFPTPISRRLVLAYRLGTKTWITFFQAAVLYALFIWRPLQALSTGRATPLAAAAALVALFGCVGGYANLALLFKLVFGFGRYSVIRRWVTLAVALLGIAAVYSYWQAGLAGLASLGRSGVLQVLFYPCELAADALVAPLAGHMPAGPTLALAAFYAATLGMVLARPENFYEAALEGSERAARLMAAAREADWATLLALWRGAETPARRPPAPAGRSLVPPFGRGAMALLWAHLSAASRRPLINLVLPVIGGIGLQIMASLWPPPRVPSLHVSALAAYVLFVATVGGIATFRQTLQRQPLVRPLPLPPWQVVLADVLPRALILSLFSWSCGFSLVLSVDRFTLPAIFGLVVCAPPVVLCLHLVQYLLALWYPDAHDKLHQLLAGVISLFLTGVTLMTLFVLVFTLNAVRAPLWTTGLLVLVPSAVVGTGLLALATVSYTRFQPR